MKSSAASMHAKSRGDWKWSIPRSATNRASGSASRSGSGGTGEVLVAEDDEHWTRHPRDFVGGERLGRSPKARGHRERVVAGFGGEAHEHARRDLFVADTRSPASFERGRQPLGAVGAEHVGAGTDDDETPEPAGSDAARRSSNCAPSEKPMASTGAAGSTAPTLVSRSAYAAGSCGRAAVPWPRMSTGTTARPASPIRSIHPAARQRVRTTNRGRDEHHRRVGGVIRPGIGHGAGA